MSVPQADRKSGAGDDKTTLRSLFTWRALITSIDGPRSATTRLVLLVLSLHMNKLGQSCFPSIELLACESGLSRQSVIKHLEIAVRGGWLGRRPFRRPGKAWRSTEYFAIWPASPDSRQPRLPASYPQDDRLGCDGGQRQLANVVNDVDSNSSLTLQRERDATLTSRRTRATKSLLPGGWTPSQETWLCLKKRNITDSEMNTMLENFLAHARARARHEADWDAAFRLWVMCERKTDIQEARPRLLTLANQRADVTCCWTAGGTEARCGEPGAIHYGGGRYLCNEHSGEYSKLMSKAAGARSHAG